MKKRKESAEVLEFPVETEDFKRFERFVSTHGLNQDEALREVLIKGMESYWPQQMAGMVSDYSRLEKRLEEYKKDNDVLNRIYTQNFELEKLLKEMVSRRNA